jgi:hypothetical protein
MEVRYATVTSLPEKMNRFATKSSQQLRLGEEAIMSKSVVALVNDHLLNFRKQSCGKKGSSVIEIFMVTYDSTF